MMVSRLSATPHRRVHNSKVARRSLPEQSQRRGGQRPSGGLAASARAGRACAQRPFPRRRHGAVGEWVALTHLLAGWSHEFGGRQRLMPEKAG